MVPGYEAGGCALGLDCKPCVEVGVGCRERKLWGTLPSPYEHSMEEPCSALRRVELWFSLLPKRQVLVHIYVAKTGFDVCFNFI